MASQRKAPTVSQVQTSQSDEHTQTAPTTSGMTSPQIHHRSPAMLQPRAQGQAAHSTYNPFRLSGQITAAPSEMPTVLEEPSTSYDSSSGTLTEASQLPPSNSTGLPRYSTLPSSGYGPRSAENASPSIGVSIVSPTPGYTAQDYGNVSAEKQRMRALDVTSMDDMNEKVELDGHADANVAEMHGDRPYADLNMELAIPHLVAIDTKEYERYKRCYCYPQRFVEPGRPTIDPLTTSFDAPPLPAGWKCFIHPEGTRYFYCDDPSNPVPVLTEAWLYDQEQCAHIHDYMRQIFKYMKDHNVSFDKATPSQFISPSPRKKRRTRNGSTHFQSSTSNDPFDESYPQQLAPIVLVLDIRLTGNTGYYFVSHPTRTIFWLDPFDYSIAVGEVHIDHPTTLIGVEMKCHYWIHNDLFPHLYELDDKDIEDIDDMVGFAIGDALTSLTGVVTVYNPDQLKQLQSIIHRYEQKRWEKRRRSVGERRMICRVMADLYHERFINLYGERGARLNYNQSIHYSPHRRKKYVPTPSYTSVQKIPWYKRLFQSPFKTKALDDYQDDERRVEADPPIDKRAKQMHHSSKWMHIVSLLMFGGPGVHIRRLRDMTVDRVVSKTALAKYIDRMMEEWRDVTLYGTVLLGANVSFLTIQSVDEAGSAGPNRTPSQRVSYFSILASIGTIVSSFLLLGRHREVMSYTFIAHRSNSRFGLESLAVMYGMPFSLAIWSIISFFLSFAILWFDNTDYVVMGLIGSFGLLFTFFLFWAVLAPYEKDPYMFFVSHAVQKVRTVGKKVRRGSVQVVKSAAKRLSSAGGVTMGDGSPPRRTRSLSSPQLTPTREAFEALGPSLRSSISSSIVKRVGGTHKHKKTWSEQSATVEGDGEPPGGAAKGSLDTGQPQESEKAAWPGGVRFDSPV
ncbi:hypothetical protein NMY22_g17391 [Coprinellus aureogranulatus]|nr:hypothetical protein NMY22_g17391 [Coprinellus aureogranulatus]